MAPAYEPTGTVASISSSRVRIRNSTSSFLKKFARLRPSPLEKSEALEQLRVLWHGYRIAVTVSKADIAPGVDTPQDLEAVRKMIR